MPSANASANTDSGAPGSTYANADSGATGNYLSLTDISYLRDVRKSTPQEQIKVLVADGSPILSSHHGYLDVPHVGPMLAHIFPSLTGSLLSISQCVNLGLKVILCYKFATFYKDNIPVFRGVRDQSSGLWMVDLKDISSTSAEIHSAGLVVKLDSAAEFVAFWHAALDIQHYPHSYRLYRKDSSGCQG